jgi:hypothetical protein
VTVSSSGTPREQCQPAEADWYVEVIFGRDVPGGTETNYSYGYYAGDQPGADEVSDLTPPGFDVLESVIKPTGR